MSRHINRFGWFLIRVVLATWVALIAIMAAHMAWLQATPADWSIAIKEFEVYSGNGETYVRVVRHVANDMDVMFAAEMRRADEPSYQVCVSSFRSVIDKRPNDTVILPIESILSNCDIRRIAKKNWPLELHIMYVVELDYGIRKKADKVSKPFKLPMEK